jgi:hypothetical protein
MNQAKNTALGSFDACGYCHRAPTTMNTIKVLYQSLLGYKLKAFGLDDALVLLKVAPRLCFLAIAAKKKG